jgi:amino acid permease
MTTWKLWKEAPNDEGDIESGRIACEEKNSLLPKNSKTSAFKQKNSEIVENAELSENKPNMGMMAATMAFTKQCLGAGILSFAANSYNGGMLSILILLPLSGGMSIFCSILMINAIEILERQTPGVRITSFEDVAERVGGRWAQMSMKIFYGMTLFFIAIVYVGIPSNYLTKLFPEALESWVWMLIFAALYIPLAWLKSLNFLSKIAVIGVIASFLTMVVIVAAAIRYGSSDSPLVNHGDWDWFPKRHFPNNTNEESGAIKFLASFATWAFGFGSVVIAPSIRNQMANKKDCKMALTYSQIFVMVLYLALAIPCILGFAKPQLGLAILLI